MEKSAKTVSTLNGLLSTAGLQPIDSIVAAKFEEYLSLILHWNARLNLTAVRDTHGILSRHFVESIACAQQLPAGIVSLLDFGTGAGFPGIPIALCRPEISVTLAESQVKKAAFLHEAVRTLQLSSTVWAGRAEDQARRFDCVTLRAVDRMDRAIAAASSLIRSGGILAVLTSTLQMPLVQAAAGESFQWTSKAPLPGSEQRILALGVKSFALDCRRADEQT